MHRLIWALCAITLILLISALGLSYWTTAGRASKTSALAAASAGVRLIEPRPTGGLAWSASSTEPNASQRAARAVAESRILSLAADLQRRLAASPRDASLAHPLGVALLLTGDIEAAISALDASLAPGTAGLHDASLLNDLAAGYLVQGSARDDAESVLQALELFQRASRADPGLAEAFFNRALALEFIGPPSLAVSAWNEYLRVDPSSPWAREAKQHRDRFAARANPSAANRTNARKSRRQVVEEDLLLQWAVAVIHHDQDAARSAFQRARAESDDIHRAAGDRYARDLVREAEHAVDQGRARLFAEAYRDGHEARRQIVELNQIDAARTLLADVTRRAGTAGAFGAYLSYWSLLDDWYRGRPDAIEAPLRELIERAQQARHGFISARARILLGSVLHRLSRYSDAIESYQRGVGGLEALDEIDAEASARMLLAAALRDNGLWADAWRNERAALARIDAMPAFAQRHNVIREAIRLALARGKTEVASLYLELLEKDARTWGDRGALFAAATYRGRVELQRGNAAAAAAALKTAEGVFESIQDASFKQSYRLELTTLRVEVYSTSRPDLAVANAQDLIAGANKAGALFRRVRAYWLLGRAEKAAGRLARAVDAWRQGITELESDEPNVREERMRIARTSDVWDIYDDLVRSLLEQHLEGDALAVAERGRARVLLDAVSRNSRVFGERPLPSRTSLPQVVIYYAMLRDETRIWVLQRDKLTARKAPGDARAVRGLIRALDAASKTGANPMPVLQDLYSLLIAPVADLVPRGQPVAIVPDGMLSAVPFAALSAPDQGRFLVEDHEITMSPSLELLRLASARLRRQPPTFSRVVAAGDGTAAGGNGLSPLPGARREAETVARLYQTEPLLGQSLSRTAFLDRVRSSEVVHFAGHAVADPDYPSRSYLALGGAGEEARLRADQITSDVFGPVQLVVLSACSTGRGDVARGEGVLSLARPFLAVGVPFVVATLRPVDDRIGALLIDFHRRLRTGLSPAAALRLAQIEAIRHDRTVNLRGWAALSLFGGLTDIERQH